MDFNKLSSNDKLAVYGSVAAIVGGLIAGASYGAYAGAWLGVVGGIAVLAIVFMPQIAPTTALPGSKGSLLLVAGGLTGAILLIIFLTSLGFVFRLFGVPDVFFLIAVAGGLVCAWAAWQEFQGEGGKFQLGSSTSGVASPAPPAPAASVAEPAPPPAASAPPVSTAPTPAPSAEPAPPADAEDGRTA